MATARLISRSGQRRRRRSLGTTLAERRRAALEPRHDITHARIASLPLQNYRLLPPLRGSLESLLRQNQRADQEGLQHIADNEAIVALSEAKELVALPLSQGLQVDPRLPDNLRYCRRWTANFLADLARAHYERFHSALQVNSAVRTVEYQRHLLRVNGNAAPAEGDTASPHLTGATIDIGKKGLSLSEVGWMRAYLLPLQSTGKLDVEEEFQQACFHITVYQSYAPVEGLNPVPPIIATRSRHRSTAALLATRLR